MSIMKGANLVLILIMLHLPAYANEPVCTDDVCRKIEKLYDSEEYEKIIELADPEKTYSEASIFYIGMSYLELAEESESSRQKEEYLKTALKFGYYPAYMELYYLYNDEDPQKAIGFLKKYVSTNPDDPDPYFILGEAEFEETRYKEADAYLKKAKELSAAHTAGIDWLLFEVNYILGNYSYAREMLDSAFSQSTLVDELSSLKSDPRFADIEKRPEFQNYRPIIEGKIKNP